MVRAGSSSEKKLSADEAFVQRDRVYWHGSPNFQGNDLRKIIEVLTLNYGGPKGQFETSPDYSERLRLGETLPLSNRMTRDSGLALVFPTDTAKRSMFSAPPIIKTDYDADAALMTVSVNISPTTIGRRSAEIGTASIIWDQYSGPTVTYRAANAFGAVGEVTDFTRTKYAISFDVLSPWNGVDMKDLGAMSYPLVVKFAIAPKKAQEISKRIRLLVLCAVAPHFPLSKSESIYSETDDGLVHSQTTFEFLHVWLSEVWIFDSDTGEVLARSFDALPPIGSRPRPATNPIFPR